MEEFENQLQQEELVKEYEETLPGASENEFTIGKNLYRRDADGTIFEFDPDRRAWFPKIDEDFIASYQMNYGTNSSSTGDLITGVTGNTGNTGCAGKSCPASDASVSDVASYSADYWTNPPTDINSKEYCLWYEQYCRYYYSNEPLVASDDTADVSRASQTPVDTRQTTDKQPHTVANSEQNVTGKKRKKDKKDLANQKPQVPPAWFELEDDKNTNVYVSGLPEDITEDEYKEFMSKVGVVAFDPVLRKPKLKLYTNTTNGSYKGDGRCCYIKPESVDLALQILDGSDIRGHIISIERAKFELKGQYDPSKKRRKMTKQEKKKFKEKQEKILGWQPEKPADARPRHERVVVIKHAFLPTLFEKDPQQLTEISADFREECHKYGDVRKVTVYDRHPEGVVTVTFRQPEEADMCILAVNRRYFGGQLLEASNWDGRTKYLIHETREEMEKRLSQWHTFLEEDSKQSVETKHEIVSSDDAAKNTSHCLESTGENITVENTGESVTAENTGESVTAENTGDCNNKNTEESLTRKMRESI